MASSVGLGLDRGLERDDQDVPEAHRSHLVDPDGHRACPW
jgi:hypothetical protein